MRGSPLLTWRSLTAGLGALALLTTGLLNPQVTAGVGGPRFRGAQPVISDTGRQASAVPSQAETNEVANGQALFTGKKRFQKGGPACSDCHGVGNLAVSHGPTPGADLTHEYSKVGVDGLSGLLAQPPFPPMNALYKKSPLTAEEKQALVSFLKAMDEAKPAESQAATAPLSPEDAKVGAALFDGLTSMRNGGPACATCHTAASIPFPFGGTMGPDLTREYSKLGPQGMDIALKTLYFPAMNPLFQNRPLTADEQKQLAAFFQSIDQQPLPSSPTGILLVVAVGVTVLLFLWAWLAVGRRRVHSVRRALLARTGMGKGHRR